MSASQQPLVMLAPMAGITDLPFRQMVQKFGVDMVVSEMVASVDLINARPGTLEKSELGVDQASTAVQLAGRDPYWMAEAAKMVEGFGAQTIDINMGCPAKKVTGGLSGSALMRDLELATAMIRATVAAVNVPVTLKCRLGWDDAAMNAPELARRAEAEGIVRMVVHGRTRCQFYKGKADWRAIGAVVDAVKIPVIANGDITSAASARRALDQSGAAGVMIGRAVQGQPWLLGEIRAALGGANLDLSVTGEALVELVVEFYRAIIAFYGEVMGVRVARKHLGWFMDSAMTPVALRRPILTGTDPEHVEGLLAQALGPRESVDA